MSPSPRAVIAAAADLFDVTTAEILSVARTARIVRARRAAIAVVHETGALSTTAIGRLFGRDHTTVLYHIRVATLRGYATDVASLRDTIDGRRVA